MILVHTDHPSSFNDGTKISISLFVARVVYNLTAMSGGLIFSFQGRKPLTDLLYLPLWIPREKHRLATTVRML